MSQKHKSGQRLLCAAGITLALLGLVSQSAAAQEAAAPSNESLTVVRDPGTGKLRSATAEEHMALQAQAQSQSAGRMRTLRAPAPQAFQQKYHASGARGVRLTDEFVSSVRAVRQPDGSIATYESNDADQSAPVAGHVHTNKVETE
jgi:hypothetical protein